MKVNYYFKNLNPKEKANLKSLVQGKIDQLSRVVKETPETALEVKGEKTAKKSAYIIEFVFRHNGKRFVSKEDDHTIQEAVDISLSGLIMQIRKAKQLRSIESPLQALGRKLKDDTRFSVFGDEEIVKQLSKKDFFEAVEDHLEKAKAFVQSEIKFLESAGDVPPGGLEADELVDDVILALWKNRESFAGKPEKFLSLFYRNALDALKVAVKELEGEREVESLEQRVGRDREDIDGEEEMEFWQPDDVLTLADTLSISRSKPSRLEQLRSRVQKELAFFSPAVRQAFNLVYQSGFSVPEAAEILKRPRKDVERDIEGVVKELNKRFSK